MEGQWERGVELFISVHYFTGVPPTHVGGQGHHPQ